MIAELLRRGRASFEDNALDALGRLKEFSVVFPVQTVINKAVKNNIRWVERWHPENRPYFDDLANQLVTSLTPERLNSDVLYFNITPSDHRIAVDLLARLVPRDEDERFIEGDNPNNSTILLYIDNLVRRQIRPCFPDYSDGYGRDYQAEMDRFMRKESDLPQWYLQRRVYPFLGFTYRDESREKELIILY